MLVYAMEKAYPGRKAMQYTIRQLTREDEAALWDMLYQALYTSEGGPPRDVIRQPEFARYVEGWGRQGDIGFVAIDNENSEALGACWLRIFSDAPGATPELAFAVRPQMRRRGIGAALLTQLVKLHPPDAEIRIPAPANNPAIRLYERFGFKVVNQTADAVRMQRQT
jgi:ribosomal protein S18 acetylase RimI-like enzyme